MTLKVRSDPPGGHRRSIPCEAVIVEDPETGETERYEVSEFAQGADWSLLEEKGKEWFREDHPDD